MLTDFGAYCYHRSLHLFDTNSHMSHHKNPRDGNIILNASLVSGAAATMASLRLGYIPMIYWMSVSCIHPLLHKYENATAITKIPGMNYLKTRHEKHHINPSKNFGPYLPIFDLIFGTEDIKK